MTIGLFGWLLSLLADRYRIEIPVWAEISIIVLDIILYFFIASTIVKILM